MATTEPTTKGARRLFSQVRKACEGLNYLSETDAPVEPFFAPAGTDLAAAIAGTGEAKPAEISADEFFARISKPQPWHTPEQRRNANGFGRLQDLLERELDDLQVFRVGRVRVDIYVVGTDKEGNRLGIRTKAVET